MYADCAKNKAKTQHFSGSGWKLVFDLACTNFGGGGASAETSLIGKTHLLKKRPLGQKKMATEIYADNVENNAKG